MVIRSISAIETGRSLRVRISQLSGPPDTSVKIHRGRVRLRDPGMQVRRGGWCRCTYVPDSPPVSAAIGRSSIPGNRQIKTDVPRNPADVALAPALQNGHHRLIWCKRPGGLPNCRRPQYLPRRGRHDDRSVEIKQSRRCIVHRIQGKIQRITRRQGQGLGYVRGEKPHSGRRRGRRRLPVGGVLCSEEESEITTTVA
jgi:hypothetical protein